jgi:lipopolysaccharide biosynthesis glycosyltransferase
MKIFVGWDSREDIAYQVCKHSIISRNENAEVVALKQEELREKGVYTRGVDPLSSTEFTFTRFLVPHLMDYQGWAVFVDCDFVFTEDVAKLFALTRNQDQYAVMVVRHDYQPKNTVKMDGKTQYHYPRKNWSSMILWNCAHPSNKQLTTELVNTATGAFLHRFQWLKDEEIGAVSQEWNWLVGWYEEPHHGKPKAIHYTEGGPWFPNYMSCEYGAVWMEEKHKYLEHIKNPPPPPSNYETIPQEIKDLFDSILKYRVDADADYYKTTLDTVIEKVKSIKKNNVVSTDSEYRYERKGMDYDPILENFVLGAGGQISTWDKIEKSMTPVVLRGITKRKQMAACKEQGRDFYYIDTGYFGNGRKKNFHRITKNSMQNIDSVIDRPADRFQATGISLTKFRPGSKILICPPSAKVMVFYNLDLEQWMQETIETIKKYTDREIVIRLKKPRSERVHNDTMAMALSQDIHCMVTFNSIAATESLLLGKPAFTLGPNAAQSLCLSDLSKIENPYIPTLDEVHKWACHLAYAQFTEVEMRNGTAWRILSETR